MNQPVPFMSNESHMLVLERTGQDQDQFDRTYGHVVPSEEETGYWELLNDKISSNRLCSTSGCKSMVTSLFPILSWLPRYSWRNDFVCDIVSGCTVAVMHIPQGMGYALLGNVQPIVGIYMAFFPVLVYFLMGTSHHISIGTFAVTTLMTGGIVDQYAVALKNSSAEPLHHNNTGVATNLEVATAVCLMVGLWQILMGVLHLGIVGIILSDHLVSGFTTGAAVHVLTSQLRSLLGIRVPRCKGTFCLVRSITFILGSLGSANGAEVIISSLTILFMAVHNNYVKPWYSKKMRFPVPVELFVLIIGTTVSYLGHLDEKYGVDVLEDIPTGLPMPQLPPVHIFASVLFDSIPVAIVAYAVSLSMAKIFARKRGYNVKNNQELLALGLSNVVGSFFSCMPVSASLSRSLLQEMVGGQTQIASVVSCSLLLAVLLWIGPYFEALPLSVLASIIVVSLKGMFVQCKDFKNALQTSPIDAMVWMITFVSVVFLDIDIGLIVGVIASVAVLIYRGQNPYSAVLGNLPGTELYVDVSSYAAAVEIPGIKIMRWAGPVNFANGETFRKVLESFVRQDSGPGAEAATARRVCVTMSQQNLERSQPNLSDNNFTETIVAVEYVIIDCSTINFIDLTGAKTLETLYLDLQKEHISLILTCCLEPVVRQLKRCLFFQKFPRNQIYPSIYDAVLMIRKHSLDRQGQFGL